ncbi:MAG: hypothetical protein DRI61_11070 [Chloroflexi bacterium]|nr:MAG: hypothetical protein DRI61_11070 [Chloroflexota bacterium]
MKAYEIPLKVTEEGELESLELLLKVLPRGKEVRAIILIPEPTDEDTMWYRLTAEQFLAGYSEADSIYDRM